VFLPAAGREASSQGDLEDASFFQEKVPTAPLIEVLGGGGEVARAVRFQMIGEELEPTQQLLPRNGFSRCTSTSSLSTTPKSRGMQLVAH